MLTLPMHMVPDPDDPELLLPFVDGAIDGRPYRFLLDSGAGQTQVLIDDHLAGAPVVGERESQGVFGKNRPDEMVALGSLVLGPIEKSGLVVVRTDNETRPSLVGMDVLGEALMHCDFDTAEVTFGPGGSMPTSWPLRRSPRGHPFLDLEFAGGATASTVWDTGAAVTAVDDGFVAAHSELFTPIGTSMGMDATGAEHETPMYRMAEANVGGITIAPHTVAAVPLPKGPMNMRIVLGYPALKQFKWTMDFPRSRWGATPAA